MRQNIVSRNEHTVYAFVDVKVVSGNDVFDVRSCKLTPISYNEFQRNMIILMTFRCFRRNFRLESGKMQE